MHLSKPFLPALLLAALCLSVLVDQCACEPAAAAASAAAAAAAAADPAGAAPDALPDNGAPKSPLVAVTAADAPGMLDSRVTPSAPAETGASPSTSTSTSALAAGSALQPAGLAAALPRPVWCQSSRYCEYVAGACVDKQCPFVAEYLKYNNGFGKDALGGANNGRIFVVVAGGANPGGDAGYFGSINQAMEKSKTEALWIIFDNAVTSIDWYDQNHLDREPAFYGCTHTNMQDFGFRDVLRFTKPVTLDGRSKQVLIKGTSLIGGSDDGTLRADIILANVAFNFCFHDCIEILNGVIFGYKVSLENSFDELFIAKGSTRGKVLATFAYSLLYDHGWRGDADKAFISDGFAYVTMHHSWVEKFIGSTGLFSVSSASDEGPGQNKPVLHVYNTYIGNLRGVKKEDGPNGKKALDTSAVPRIFRLKGAATSIGEQLWFDSQFTAKNQYSAFSNKDGAGVVCHMGFGNVKTDMSSVTALPAPQACAATDLTNGLKTCFNMAPLCISPGNVQAFAARGYLTYNVFNGVAGVSMTEASLAELNNLRAVMRPIIDSAKAREATNVASPSVRSRFTVCNLQGTWN